MPPRAPVFDEATMNAFTCRDAALQAELLAMLHDYEEPVLGAMRDAHGRGDRAEYSAAAHKLKGLAPALGLLALSDAVSREADASTARFAVAAIERIAREFKHAKLATANRLGGATAPTSLTRTLS